MHGRKIAKVLMSRGYRIELGSSIYDELYVFPPEGYVYKLTRQKIMHFNFGFRYFHKTTFEVERE